MKDFRTSCLFGGCCLGRLLGRWGEASFAELEEDWLGRESWVVRSASWERRSWTRSSIRPRMTMRVLMGVEMDMVVDEEGRKEVW